MPLWCKNDPVVRITSFGDREYGVIRIITKALFNDGHEVGEDDEVLLHLDVPQTTKAKVIKEFQVPELPQVFEMDEITKLKVTNHLAACELDIELSDGLDPENRGDCLELVVTVKDRHRVLLAQHHFKPDRNDGGMAMLSFNVVLEGHDHTDDVVHSDSSTWT